jgi:hypothetical protein
MIMKVTRRQLRNLIRESLGGNLEIVSEARPRQGQEPWRISGIPYGSDVSVKWGGEDYAATLVDSSEDQYYVKWDDGKFDWVPKSDVKKKSDVKTKPEEISSNIGNINDAVLEIAWKVLGAEGMSKSYGSDKMGLGIDHVGKTFVGILHFTTSGMQRLYDAMQKHNVIEKYFEGKALQDLEDFTAMARGKEKQLGERDPEKHGWWLEGMKKFLDSPDSIPVQDEAVLRKFADRVPKYRAMGYPFRTMRDLAIFMSLGNSAWGYVQDYGRATGWDPDEMMKLYCGRSDRTRCKLTDRYYPRDPKTL